MVRMWATLLLLAVCALTAFAAQGAGTVPLPFLLGPLIASSVICTVGHGWVPAAFPGLGHLRLGFIAVIGLMIGVQVTPDLFQDPGRLAPSILAVLVFVPLSIACNFVLFHKLGRYDRVTAFYAAMPGGLYESIAFGEAAGADPARLVLQQFLRVILIVTLLPIGLSLWLGGPVGSAAGLSLAHAETALPGLALALGASLGGTALGRALHLPAWQLTGPMAFGAALSLGGIGPPQLPAWLIDMALIVVGTALGTRFCGLSRRRIAQGMGLAALSVTAMLLLAGCAALMLAHWTGQGIDLLLISFAPGGVTEMTLIALSLAGAPALVTLHHVLRILLTVVIMAATARHLQRPPP